MHLVERESSLESKVFKKVNRKDLLVNIIVAYCMLKTVAAFHECECRCVGMEVVFRMYLPALKPSEGQYHMFFLSSPSYE